MFSYKHKVQYYETDKMGIVHHSNYIRWFEEARTEALESLGIGYDYLEEQGIIAPIVSASANYKYMTKFGETVLIQSKIVRYTGIRLVVSYEVYDEATNMLRCIGETVNCFLNEDGKPMDLKRTFPDVHEIFKSHTE